MAKKFPPLNINTLAISLGIFLIAVNFFYLNVYTIRKYTEALKYDGYPEVGSQFADFKEILGDKQRRVGYITDKDTSREKNDGIYLQAQYYLAPAILELQEENHQFIILDSTNIEFIIKTIRRLNAKRLTSNEYGQALLVRLPL